MNITPEASADETQIRAMIEKRPQAVAERDVDTLASFYASDALLFEVLPPLTSLGADVWKSTEAWFATYESDIGYDISDLNITVGADVAFTNYLYLITGTTKKGDGVKMGVRTTTCWRKVDDSWIIVHEHQSVPFDPETGMALTDLAP